MGDNEDVAIETSVLVCDYLRFKLERSDYVWSSCPPLPRPPMEVSHSLRALGEEFEEKYSETFSEMCSQLQFTKDTANETFHGVLNEVFSMGITWSRVIAVFSFSGALALQCVKREMPDVVSEISTWLSNYIDENLIRWIEDHGGWNGIIEFQQSDGDRDIKEAATWQSLRTFFCSIAAGALGALTIGAVLTSRT